MVCFCSNTYGGSTVVAFQFSRIGNDLGGARLLEELDEDPYVGDCIDVFQVEFDLKIQMKDKWFMVCQSLLLSEVIDSNWKPCQT